MPQTTTNPTTVEVNGFALREIRKLHGVGVRELAEALECDRSYVARIETGSTRRVSPKFYRSLLDVLHIADRRALLAAPHSPQEIACQSTSVPATTTTAPSASSSSETSPVG